MDFNPLELRYPSVFSPKKIVFHSSILMLITTKGWHLLGFESQKSKP
jgi:hypothetical protein